MQMIATRIKEMAPCKLRVSLWLSLACNSWTAWLINEAQWSGLRKKSPADSVIREQSKLAVRLYSRKYIRNRLDRNLKQSHEMRLISKSVRLGNPPPPPSPQKHKETRQARKTHSFHTGLVARVVIFSCVCPCQGQKTIRACHENTCVQERDYQASSGVPTRRFNQHDKSQSCLG